MKDRALLWIRILLDIVVIGIVAFALIECHKMYRVLAVQAQIQQGILVNQAVMMHHLIPHDPKNDPSPICQDYQKRKALEKAK